MNPEIIDTGDGSHSLFLPELNETYHSRKGALTESIYVYITQGLAKQQKPNLAVLEFGFGTGLNALLTWQYAIEHQVKVRYYTTELFPLELDLALALNYGQEDQKRYDALHEASWNEWVDLDSNFSIYKHHGRFLDHSAEEVDVIYYDAFAPSKQAEVWELDYLQKAWEALKPGGMLVTYCAQGQFKRNLKSLGFEVETLAGPPGKQEMVRATKP
ncbi:MAG: methyltransferase [Bacteroidetes bacterium]|nr:MAG: methyltransferase [Bacteroidota bacterium]